jgi:hypothetical protein
MVKEFGVMNEKSAVGEITAEVIDAARQHPNGWVYKIEGTFGSEDYVPPESIVGAWKVDEHGQLTGEFVKNPKYQPGTSKTES